MDYKDWWQRYYDEALDEGLSDDEAATQADTYLADWYASKADEYKLRMKYDE